MQESWAYMHITYRITTCTYTKLIHIHSRGFMHMGLAKSDACWFTRGLWDSLCCSTYPFSRQNHISTKQQGPHQWVKMHVPRGISLHLHGNAPARAIGVLSQSKLDLWKKWPGVFPLEIHLFPHVFPPFFRQKWRISPKLIRKPWVFNFFN